MSAVGIVRTAAHSRKRSRLTMANEAWIEPATAW